MTERVTFRQASTDLLGGKSEARKVHLSGRRLPRRRPAARRRLPLSLASAVGFGPPRPRRRPAGARDGLHGSPPPSPVGSSNSRSGLTFFAGVTPVPRREVSNRMGRDRRRLKRAKAMRRQGLGGSGGGGVDDGDGRGRGGRYVVPVLVRRRGIPRVRPDGVDGDSARAPLADLPQEGRRASRRMVPGDAPSVR
jgi:hypothetical protein